jgi:hypothetical protein
MSYQDKATAEELAYLEAFRQHQAEIIAYKAQHGGDLEGAFQKVTGVPWPQNRSVKLTNGAPEITADRTFKSVMGRYVAPIAAGVAGGFALPALLGGGAAAGAGGAASGAAAAGGAGAAGTAATVATAAGASKSVWDRLRDISGNPLVGTAVGAAGKALEGTAAGAAHNRGVELDANIENAKLKQQAERDYDNANIARSADDRAGQKSAWEMLNHAAYVANAPKDLNTTKLSPYSKSIAGPGDDARAGASALMGQTRDDLMSGRFRTNGGAPLPMPQRTGADVTIPRPGAFERIGGILGPVFTGVGGVAQRTTEPVSRPQVEPPTAAFTNPDLMKLPSPYANDWSYRLGPEDYDAMRAQFAESVNNG